MHVSGEFRSLTTPEATLVHWTESQTQSEIVSLLQSQQQVPVGVMNPDRPEHRAGSALVTGSVMGNNQQIANTGVIRMIAQRLMRCRVAK